LKRVLINTRTFGKYSKDPIDLLVEAGFEIINADGKDITPYLKEADALIVGTTSITGDMLRESKIKIVAKHGVGLDNIDVVTATELGIPVTITRGANTSSVAELALAFILALARKVVYVHCDVICKRSWPNIIGMELENKVLGLLGFGAIARNLSKKTKCLSMTVIAHDPFVSDDEIAEQGVTPVNFKTLLEKSDFLSVHVPLTEDTENLITEKELRCMKSTSFLINTARGGIVNEKELARALKENWIAGAALDVFSKEPLDFSSPLLECDNIIVTPHMGAHTKEAIYKMNIMAAQAVIDFFDGRIPSNVVNKEALKNISLEGYDNEN
jgi:D-3-phosphoglycerate dehydrogenase